MSIDSETFAIKAMDCGDDEINAWSQEILKNKTTEEFDFINDQILKRRPDSEDRLKYFMKFATGLILQGKISTLGSTLWIWKKAACHQNNFFQYFERV